MWLCSGGRLSAAAGKGAGEFIRASAQAPRLAAPEKEQPVMDDSRRRRIAPGGPGARGVTA
jgi:hypothetical protein